MSTKGEDQGGSVCECVSVSKGREWACAVRGLISGVSAAWREGGHNLGCQGPGLSRLQNAVLASLAEKLELKWARGVEASSSES